MLKAYADKEAAIDKALANSLLSEELKFNQEYFNQQYDSKMPVAIANNDV